MAAGSVQAYPSDEEEHGGSPPTAGGDGLDTEPTEGVASAASSPRRTETFFPGGEPTTPLQQTPAGAGHGRMRAASESRRHVFRRMNDGALPFSSEPVALGDAPLTPQQVRQPARSRSDGSAALSRSAEFVRYARPVRARARTVGGTCMEDMLGGGSGGGSLLERAGSCREVGGGAAGLSGMPTPPHRMRARTLSYDTPSASEQRSDDDGVGCDLEEAGLRLHVRQTSPREDEILERDTPEEAPPVAAPTASVLRERLSAVSASRTQKCQGWIFAHGRRARAAVCVGLYMLLVTFSPLYYNAKRHHASELNRPVQQQQKLDSDFGREIHFDGMGMAFDHEKKLVVEADVVPAKKEAYVNNHAVQQVADVVGPGKAKAHHKKKGTTGKKKRRPVLAQARTLDYGAAPLFVPKMEDPLKPSLSGKATEDQDKDTQKIRTFVLPEEDMAAPSPEDLLPPDHQTGPSTLLKIVTLSAWLCLTILVLETGFREVQRRFQYVHLRQLRAHNEDRSR